MNLTMEAAKLAIAYDSFVNQRDPGNNLELEQDDFELFSELLGIRGSRNFRESEPERRRILAIKAYNRLWMKIKTQHGSVNAVAVSKSLHKFGIDRPALSDAMSAGPLRLPKDGSYSDLDRYVMRLLFNKNMKQSLNDLRVTPTND